MQQPLVRARPRTESLTLRAAKPTFPPRLQDGVGVGLERPDFWPGEIPPPRLSGGKRSPPLAGLPKQASPERAKSSPGRWTSWRRQLAGSAFTGGGRREGGSRRCPANQPAGAGFAVEGDGRVACLLTNKGLKLSASKDMLLSPAKCRCVSRKCTCERARELLPASHSYFQGPFSVFGRHSKASNPMAGTLTRD